MTENNLNDQINMLGSGTIMGSMSAIDNEVKENIEKLQDAVAETKEAEAAKEGAITGDTHEAMAKAGYFRKTRPIVRDYKISRNDPCPCGSHKKYKNCCMNTGKYETTHYE